MGYMGKITDSPQQQQPSPNEAPPIAFRRTREGEATLLPQALTLTLICPSNSIIYHHHRQFFVRLLLSPDPPTQGFVIVPSSQGMFFPLNRFLFI